MSSFQHRWIGDTHTGITASQPAGVDGRSGLENIMIGQLWTVGELLNASNDTSRERPARPTRQMGGIYARKRAMIMRPTEGERKREATKNTVCTESRVGSRHEAGGNTGQQSCRAPALSTLFCVPERSFGWRYIISVRLRRPFPRCEHCNIKSYNFFFIINYNCDNKRRITPSQATHDGCPGDERLRTSADRCGDGKTPTTVSNSISLDWGRGCVGAVLN